MHPSHHRILFKLLTLQGYFEIATILAIIFRNYTGRTARMKRNLICSIINLVQGLPHELPNNLRLRITRNQEILEKSQILVEVEPSSQSLFQKLNNSSQENQKVDIKASQSCPTLLDFPDFSTLFQIFCPRMQVTYFKKFIYLKKLE